MFFSLLIDWTGLQFLFQVKESSYLFGTVFQDGGLEPAVGGRRRDLPECSRPNQIPEVEHGVSSQP